MALKSEFFVQPAYPYDRSGPIRWIWSHVWRYKRLFLQCVVGFMIGYIGLMIASAACPIKIRA